MAEKKPIPGTGGDHYIPAEKTLDSFDFGFQRGVSKEQMLRLSDMTWLEQAFNICFLPGH